MIPGPVSFTSLSVAKPRPIRWGRGVLVAAVFQVSGLMGALPVAAAPESDAAAAKTAQALSVNDWLRRMHEAGRKRTYLGTYVVSNNMGSSSARIWHACDGVESMERVETLTGAPRTTIRHNDQVVTYLADSKTAVLEKREGYALFSALLGNTKIPDFYTAHLGAQERVAGRETQRVDLTSRDRLRYGYRIWADKATGLVVKLQTLDVDGTVLEEAAFSEIQMDAPVKMDNIAKLMKANTDESRGIRLVKPQMQKTTAAAEGWILRSPVPGFRPVTCYKGTVSAREPAMQWVFTDGLASVSIFAEPYDRSRHQQEGGMRVGSTQTWAKRSDQHWLTLVGEVPLPTLKAFASSLERKH